MVHNPLAFWVPGHPPPEGEFLGGVPHGCSDDGPHPSPQEDKTLINVVNELPGAVDLKMQDADIQNALVKIFEVLIKCNQYVTQQEPWVLAKKDPERLRTVLYMMIESMRIVALLLSPVMPEKGRLILDAMGVPPELRVGREVWGGGGGWRVRCLTGDLSIALRGGVARTPAEGGGHHATFSTAPAHQRLGSANAETTPAGAPAAAADRTQRPDATCGGKNG